MNRLQILTGTFDCITRADTVEWARSWIASGQRGWICTVNAAILMMMRNDPELQRFVDDAALTVADGQPLVWYSRLADSSLPERVTGADLVGDLCEMASLEGYRVYLLGAEREVIEAVAETLERTYWGLEICGFDDGYFGADEAEDRASAIRESGADILITGMGVPRQERFIADHWDQLDVPLAIPVGGSFEVIAGRKQRAPRWVQTTGFEWLYRLAQEPDRLWRRYLVTNTQFLYRIALEAMDGGPRAIETPTGDAVPRAPHERLIGKGS